ncbi:unnamed protein product [Adineta steineri]|uniref:Kinesin motor domain-containing protein n=2 Tax=Adineta steineri TaxID=433720 RepID=A0A815UYK9_9BILA|nr:unnamed protein product [Adineta steineri]CAF1520503.1 unnamed protein product [Adineta steineri]CAF1619276.1 unnamed protein product [Adineta steineri]CAF1650128.1 unnamed protein product [Adineta steineri]CAF3881053.1 unnamed protein product [Adineta steineri]
MLATISLSSTVIDETINILRYAGLSVTITNVLQIKTPHLRHEIDELREENARLKQEFFLVKSIHSTTSTNTKVHKSDDTKLHRRLGTIFSYVTNDF